MNDLTECGSSFPVPADHSADALGEMAADCALAPGHAGDHSNGMAVWAAEEPTPTDRADLVVPLVDGLSDDTAEVLRDLVRLAELALGSDATDADLLADALASLDGLLEVTA